METSQERQTARIESFSDGVFAIAITLLILNLRVPTSSETMRDEVSLLNTLSRQWPVFVSFLISFVTILIMWINHHRLFRLIVRVDHMLLLLNGAVMLMVTLAPFPTALLAEHLTGNSARSAAILYASYFVLNAIAFGLLWRYASIDNRLIDKSASLAEVSDITMQYRLWPLFYLAALLMAFVHPYLTIGACGLLALLFGLPPRTERRRQPDV